MIHSTHPSDELLAASVLADLGYAPSAGGYENDPFRLRTVDDWLVIETSGAAPAEPRAAQLGWPGLWKQAAEPGRMVFELPLRVVREWASDDDLPDAQGDQLSARLAGVLEWAQATADGSDALRWTAPSIDEVQQLLPAEQMTVEAGGVARQIRLIRNDHRLAMELALTANWSPALSPARVDWVDRVLAEVNRRKRLVRLGRRADGAWAEVDLTGIPPALRGDLLPLAAASLRMVGASLVVSLDALADPGVASAILELGLR
jgi:hypothetical protein